MAKPPLWAKKSIYFTIIIKIDIDLISTVDQAICYQLYICIILNTYINSMNLFYYFIS